MNFLKSVKIGKLIAEVRNVHRSSKIYVSDAEVKDGEGDPIAKGLVTYYIIKDQTTIRKEVR